MTGRQLHHRAGAHLDGAESADSIVDARPRRVHPEGDGLPVVKSLQELVTLLDGRQSIYLRYSRGPERDAQSEASRDYEADVMMPGVSVCAIAPEAWWPRPAEDWIARRVRQYADLADEDRFPWLLTGRVVGNGPDHEPLVTDIRPIAKVDRAVMHEAADVYRSRFRVGRDSTDRESA